MRHDRSRRLPTTRFRRRGFGLRGISRGSAFAACVLVLALAGCSKKRSSPTGPGAHPEAWMDGDSPSFHGTKVAAEGTKLCLGCHTITTPASKDSAKALSCANTSDCHAAVGGPGALDCESCHKTSELPAGHPGHLAALGAGAATCGYCHAQTVEAGGTVIDSTHMDAEVEVQLGKGAVGTFTGTTCANSNCHSGTSPTWSSGTTLDCNGCHQKGSLSDAHAAHFLAIANDCSICHSATATDSTGIANQTKHLSLAESEDEDDIALASAFGGVFDEDEGTCSGTYCHDVLTARTTPEWDGTTDLDCQGCHPDGLLPGAHAKHLAQFEDDCSVCHFATVSDSTTIINRAKHANKTKDVAMRVTWGGTFSSASGSCQSTYCHNPLSAGSSPSWTSGVPLGCESCHANASLSGAHAEHLAATGGRCDYCHDNTATPGGTVKPNAPHVDKSKDVAMSAEVGGVFDVSGKKCSNTRCHGSATTPSWNEAAVFDCNSCHPIANLPGAHADHLVTTGGGCDICHSRSVDADGRIIPGGSHNDGHKDVAIDTVEVRGTVWIGQFSGGTCSGTYCHGAQPSTPAWTDLTPLGCGTCHPTGSLSPAHADHLDRFSGDCSTCHSVTASGPTAVSDRTIHADGTVQVSMKGAWGGTYASQRCSGTWCHSPLGTGTSPFWTDNTPLGCQSCHANANLPGRHATHLASTGGRCDICHDATATPSGALRLDAPHINKSFEVVLNDTAQGTYSGGTNGTCSGTSCHGAQTTTPIWTSSTKLACGTCHVFASLSAAHGGHFQGMASNCSVCHATTATDSSAIANAARHANFVNDVAFGAGIGGSFAGTDNPCAGTYCHSRYTGAASPAWADAMTPVTCESCHPKASLTSLPGAHADHLDEFAGDCSICHAATVSGATAITNRGRHANQSKDVVLGGVWGGTYGSQRCSGTWCHSPLGTGTSPLWTDSSPLGCQSCHANASLSARHATHLASTVGRCDICHDATADSLGALRPDAPHVDRKRDVVMGAHWGGTFDTLSVRCSGTYCHGAQTITPAWTNGTKLSCTTCHPTQGLSGAHGGHVDKYAGDCSICHVATVSDGATVSHPEKHANHTADVALGISWGGTFASHRCSDTWCHSPLPRSGPSPEWTDLAQLGCESCHPKAALRYGHASHLVNFADDCTICHFGTASSSTAIKDESKHVDGVKDVVLSTTWGGTFDAPDTTCSGTYCHKTANDSTTPRWTSGSPLDCQGCHPDASLPIPHAKHLQSYPSRCDYCHNLTVLSPNTLQPNPPHISDSVEVKMSPTFSFITYTPETKHCSAGCHVARNWR